MWPTLVLFLFFPCRNFCAENFVSFFCEIKLLFTYLLTYYAAPYTLGIECKGMLSTGVYKVLVGGGSLTWSTISSSVPILFSHRGSGRNYPHDNESLWRGLGILGLTQGGGSYRPGRLLPAGSLNITFPVWV